MLQLNFTPFPILATERLTLRRLNSADAPALFEMRADPQVMQFIPRPLATTVADAADYVQTINDMMDQNELINWGITTHNDSQVIGTIGFFRLKPEHFRAEVGYMLNPRWQGKGLMQEALAAVLHYGFEVLKLHSVEAVIAPQNAASARVLERCHFVQEGHFKENEFWDGKFLDTMYYSLLRPDRR